MEYMNVKEASEKWKISERMIRRYCDQERIDGVIHVGGTWIIPTDAPQPNESKPEAVKLAPLANRIVYQRSKNNHFGIYEYIQVNLAYSSNRMASNRLTRKQVEEAYRTNKITTAFEPMKVDDLIEVMNHFLCVQYVVDSISAPLTQSYIKKLHGLLTYGTYADRKRKVRTGEYRKEPAKLGMPPKEIYSTFDKLLKDYEGRHVDLNAILDFHVQFERIHPFDDYNGRVGRVLMLKECLRHDIVPFIIDDKHRGEYNLGITQWDMNSEILRSASQRAQNRFQAQLELCKLMQYRRPLRE